MYATAIYFSRIPQIPSTNNNIKIIVIIVTIIRYTLSRVCVRRCGVQSLDFQSNPEAVRFDYDPLIPSNANFIRKKDE
jgi:hypothetical protein